MSEHATVYETAEILSALERYMFSAPNLYDIARRLIAERDEMRAVVERLRKMIVHVHKVLVAAPELNMNNYTEEDVDDLNRAVNAVCCQIEEEAAAAKGES